VATWAQDPLTHDVVVDALWNKGDLDSVMNFLSDSSKPCGRENAAVILSIIVDRLSEQAVADMLDQDVINTLISLFYAKNKDGLRMAAFIAVKKLVSIRMEAKKLFIKNDGATQIKILLKEEGSRNGLFMEVIQLL